MIRTDEYYNNVVWEFLKQNVPLTRLFYCDPPGRSDPDSLYNYGSDITESNYILMHDQEPIHFEYHRPLFEDAVRRNLDLNHNKGATHKGVVTSEYKSEYADQLARKYNWKTYYYFFNGWVSLEWFRGYNRTFLRQFKNIEHTFLCPNNIIGGERRHRLELFQQLEQLDLVEKNLISFPSVCPYENLSVTELCKKYNISNIKTDLPLVLDKVDNHANASHELNLWEYANKSLLQLVTETAFYGDRLHLTEKTFKPIAMQQPFVIASCRNSLEYLKSYGFETFSSVWDESYDSADDEHRCSKIAELLKYLEQQDKQELQKQCAPIVEHNFNHFYSGAFERILWDELNNMLQQIKNDFSI